ncbi:DUF3450 family protein [Pseudoalteromonas tunicata]|uniref:DUF3450 family protein n=1 Tax=Pseudoalteromonas tunicata TaxID=314281 RepID=UPI00273D40D7|nr:DUF3450 family protein [Pseudoalteromonas tunicata]MDP5212232.1 DUF3450 family protein [Pseudoalteromonas tunicata]
MAISNVKLRRISFNNLLWLSGVVAMLFSVTLRANPVAQADALVQQWLNLSGQQSALKAHWAAEQPILQQRIELLKQEQLQLKTLLQQNHTKGSEVEQKRTQLLALQTDMERDQQQLKNWLVMQFTKVNNLRDRLPPPLAKQWQIMLQETDLAVASEGDKLALLLSLFTKLNEFDQRIAFVQSTIVTPDQHEKLVKQLYLGIARGWYISLDGQEVFEGLATDQGWIWQKNDVLQPGDISAAIAMVEQQTEAAFIRLPLQINHNDALLNIEVGHE